MSDFKIVVQNADCYDIMNPEKKSIPARIEWEGKVIRVHFDADEYDSEDLRDTEWPELARLICETLSRYLYSESKKPAQEFLAWLDDDSDDEKRCMIEIAEQEYRVPFAITAVRRALRMLGTEARDRVLREA